MVRTPFRRSSALHAGCPLVFSCVIACSSTTQSTSAVAPSAELRRSNSESSAPNAEQAVVAASTLDRAAFIRAVLAKNPSVDAARQGWRAALARVRQAGNFDDPMLELGVAPLSLAPSSAPVGYEVAISQKLPWFGKRSLEEEASVAEAEAAESDVESVKRELALGAVTLYGEYFVAARSLEINAAHVELLRALHASAVAQFASGRGSEQDALQAEAELTHIEHDAVVLASRRDITVAQMNELLHRAPELPLPPPPTDLALPLASDRDAAEVEASAIGSRPDIRAATQHARAAEARAERADRDDYPDFTVSTSYNSMWDMPQHRWMVGLGLNLPIQTGRRAGAADEARAMQSQFQSDAARMTDAARTQAFVSHKQLEESRHVLELFETRLLPVAKDQIDAARAGFVTSRNPFAAVIEAERNLRGVELEYQMMRAEYVRRRAELDRALGRIPGLDWKEEKP